MKENTVICKYGICGEKQEPVEVNIKDWLKHLKEFHPDEYESMMKEQQNDIPEWKKLLDAECKKNNTTYVVLTVTSKDGKVSDYNIYSPELDPFQVVGMLWTFLNKMR